VFVSLLERKHRGDVRASPGSLSGSQNDRDIRKLDLFVIRFLFALSRWDFWKVRCIEGTWTFFVSSDLSIDKAINKHN